MKILAILLILSSLAFSKTSYVTPPVIVSGSILYCTDYYGNNILEHKIGDIVDGEIAVERCAYNKDSVQEKQMLMRSMHSEEQDNNYKTTIKSIIAFMSLLLLLMVFTVIFPAKRRQMRVIALALVIVAIFFFAKDAHGRTIILDEEQVETVEGKTFYVLTMCKDSYQYTGYHKGALLDFKIIQDFEQTATSNQPIPCQMDFKHESQLTK